MRAMPRTVRTIYAALAVWIAVAGIRNAIDPELDLGPVFARLGHGILGLIAGALCLARAVRHREERTAWALIGSGVLAWASGDTYYTLVLVGVPSPPIPSPADVGFLLIPPLVLAGMVLLVRARRPEGAAGPLQVVDGAIAALAVGALDAAIVFDAVAGTVQGDPVVMGVVLSYPLMDLVLAGSVVGALAATGWRLDRTWALLGTGVLAFWLADSLFLVDISQGDFKFNAWYETGFWIGMFSISLAAWQPHRPAPPMRGVRLILMPLSFAVIGLGLLLYAAFAPVGALAVVLAACALLAVMGRLVLTFREHARMLERSRSEALTDALTGLGNRRSLTRDLEQGLRDADDGRPLVLALFDLDGFKLYNDTFGHPAGDALLVRLAGALSVYVNGRGTAYRMGGDEFCVLLDPRQEVAQPLLEGARAALSEHGEGFAIGCSYGSIMLPREAPTASDALRIADHRMYTQKASGRASASRQSKDVLVRALAERNPALSEHGSDVAAHAEAVAVRLGLDGEAAEQVRHAAELHDVGKVAIPDTILNKPGPLSDEEWGFLHRHTMIGERIVGAAPALAGVARLIRSSHERWDGGGYPDGLAERAIPLGSRVVAVADAFDAMVAQRPYRPPRTATAALAELRACSGTQFDPVVVEAFLAVWADRHAPAAAAGGRAVA